MKRSFSILVLMLFLISCSGKANQAIDVYNKYRETLKLNDTQGALKYWHPSIINLNKDLILKSSRRTIEEFGELLFNELIEVIATKRLQTWIFSGIVFHDVIQLDIAIRMPKVKNLPHRLEVLVEDAPLVVREFVHLVEFHGEMKIVNCEMRK